MPILLSIWWNVLHLPIDRTFSFVACPANRLQFCCCHCFNFVREEDDEPKKKVSREWNAPKWTQGLIVKPDEKWTRYQVRLWGIITGIGLALPPAQEYLGRFTWLILIAQLTYRGINREALDGSIGMRFGVAGGGGHRKVAFFLGLLIWFTSAVVIYGFMPSWAKGKRWTGTMAFTMQNLLFGISSCYLQPYKGK